MRLLSTKSQEQLWKDDLGEGLCGEALSGADRVCRVKDPDQGTLYLCEDCTLERDKISKPFDPQE